MTQEEPDAKVQKSSEERHSESPPAKVEVELRAELSQTDKSVDLSVRTEKTKQTDDHRDVEVVHSSVDELTLGKDFYAMTFISMTTKVKHEFSLSTQTQGRNFYMCCWIFFVQLLLTTLIFKTVVFDTGDFKIFTPSLQVYLCRFVCTLCLHVQLIDEVRQGKEMLEYLILHPQKFDKYGLAAVVAIMQIFGGFWAEITNMFMMATQQSVEYCVSFYIAFNVLS